MLAVVALAGALAVGGSRPAQAGGFDPDPVFPVGHISATVSHQIPKLEHVASALAGRHAVVNCWSNRGWAQLQAWEGGHFEPVAVDAVGLTQFSTHRIELSPFVCQILAQGIEHPAAQPLFTAWAVTVLAHESAHVSGIAAENRAECRAVITEPRAAELLGISRPLVRRFQHVYRGTVYPYDVARYRTPPCAAGRPGVVVPDTLGSAASLRPLEQVATAVDRSVAPWKDIGGAFSVGPLSPCSPIRSRSWELARLGRALLGPRREHVVYAAVTLKTERDLASSLTRYQASERCELSQLRAHARETHSDATYSRATVPPRITSLSPQVRAFRELYTTRGERWNRDSIFVFDSAARTIFHLYFAAPVGRLPVAVEVRAVSALLRDEATMARRSGR
jgi:hypothetical protein